MISTTFDTSRWVKEAHRDAGWLIALGVFALIAPFASGIGVTVVLGIAMLIGGIARLFAAFKAASFGSGTLAFLWGLIVAVTGLYILGNPGLGLASLTLVLSVMFFVSALIQVIVAFEMKPASGPSSNWLSAACILHQGILRGTPWPGRLSCC